MTESPSSSFDLLDERVRRWIWQHEWTELRDIQERAIPLLLAPSADVILSASTASGKTEAAFFPILSALLNAKDDGLAVYISPLTALINDQFSRLNELCEQLGVPVHPWHGDIPARLKKGFVDAPGGILLITPESLEALFCLRGPELPRLLGKTRYLVIDELHSFIGNERGKQLQTLLFLVEERLKRTIPRIGLSATLGNMDAVKSFLSPPPRTCAVISSGAGPPRIKLLVKGILQELPAPDAGAEDRTGAAEEEESALFAARQIGRYLWDKLRGSNNLIFPNSRGKVELYTHILSSICEEQGTRNEFFAHHGNLSKEIREEAEMALRAREKSATVICTNTLELGIDIGDVASVAQIECPPSVASLRQRLGRSGRRPGSAAALRAFACEKPSGAHLHPFSQLRESVFSLCACVSLLLEGWCETPPPDALHLSTLVQQIIALTMESASLTPERAFNLLCERGPFNMVSRQDFLVLIKALAAQKLLELSRRNELLLGEAGERQSACFSFYAAFASRAEYRIISDEKTLGTLPVNTSIQKNDVIIFAGKTWKVQRVDENSLTIEVRLVNEGRPPVFSGGSWSLSKKLREKMRELYETRETLPFTDPVAARFIEEGRQYYREHKLGAPGHDIIERERYTVLCTWLSDRANRALQLLFRHHGWTAYSGGLGITAHGKRADELSAFLDKLAAEGFPGTDMLLKRARNLCVGKWDRTLPPRLLKKNYASMYLDIEEAGRWLSARAAAGGFPAHNG